MKLFISIFFTLICTTNHILAQETCEVVDTDESLIAYFPLDGNAEEELGSGFNGTVNGASLANDRNEDPNSAYLFDGNNDFIHIGDHFDLGESNFTVSCWVNVLEFKDLIPGTNSRGGWIINKGVTIFGTPRRAGYALDARKLNGENYFYFFVGDQSNNIYNANGFGFKEDIWYSLIATKDTDSISLYVDNTLISTTPLPSSININTNIPLVLGSIDKLGNDLEGTTYFDGLIDDVRIYNRVLNFDERDCLVNGCTLPFVNLGEDQSGCQGSSILLEADFPNATYRWNNGSSKSTLEVTQSGIYWVEVENFCGTFRDSISIELSNIPNVDLGSDRIVCDTNSIELSATFPNATYRWQDGSQNSTLEVNQSGIYWVEVENSCGLVRDSVKIDLNTIKNIDLGADRVVCDSSFIELSPTVMDAVYKWQDGSQNATLAVNQSGTYWVEVKNSCGIKSDTIQLIFRSIERPDIPNIFTPNGDKKNEYFQIDDQLLGASIEVYNRWGQSIYTNSDYQNNWNGKNLSSGIYYWLITDVCKNRYKGHVTILR